MEVRTRQLWESRLGRLYPFAKRSVLASFRGKAALERAVAHTIRAPLALLPVAVRASLKQSFEPVARLDYNRHKILLHVDSTTSLYRTLSCRKEPETVRWIEEYIRPGEVLYDVGANVGAYSLVASKYCGGDVRVFAFEPSFATYYELCRNVILNRCQSSIFPQMMCLTDSPGLVVFNYSSLEGGTAYHTVGTTGHSASGDAAVYQQQVLGYSIDFLVERFGFPAPHHIKIDVDGIEGSILRGATKTFQSGVVRTVQLESSPHDVATAQIQAFMLENGFKLVSESARGGGETWKNYLFVRQSEEGATP